jgi:small GTP-binding protein
MLVSSHLGDRKVYIWDPGTGKIIRRLKEDGKADVINIAWSAAANVLAIAFADGSIELWNPYAWKLKSRLQHAIFETTFGLAWAPDGILLASGEQDSEVRIFDISKTASPRILKGHGGQVLAVAWSPGGRILASGGTDRAVLLWNPSDGTRLARLEGHLDSISCIRFSYDDKMLCSASSDHVIRIWDTVSGTLLAVIKETRIDALGNGIDFSPSASQLATIGALGSEINIWRVDAQPLVAADAHSIRYITARLVLVGDSGVGKTGLGWRLARGVFKEHPSTHGQQFWTLKELETTRADGVDCEAVIWDLAGQPDYRLVHSLFLDTIDLALLLFDPTNRLEPLAGVDYWLRLLQAEGESQTPPIILIGARIDRGSSSLTDTELATICRQRGISGSYIATSAKEGDGLDELITRIKSLVPWETMSATVTTNTFKHVRDYVLSLKEKSTQARVLISAPELRLQLEDARPDWDFSDAEMITAVRHTETHGYVRLLQSAAGDEFILLAPEILSGLASSIILEARREPNGLGALEEARLLEGNYRLPELDGLDPDERRILLDAVVLLFLKHNICFREYLGSRVLLIFPSLINERRPMTDDSPIMEDISYTLSGAVENIYAALVVLLGYTNTFTRTGQWQNQAQYELTVGEICGFRQVNQQKGTIELVLYYGAITPVSAKQLFQGLFETFLIRRKLSIVRYRPVTCSKCHERQDRTVVMKQVDRKRDFMFCANCGLRLVLPSPEDLTIKVDRDQKVQDQKQVADHRTAFEAGLVNIKSLLLERSDARTKPTCFISYAWGVPEHERWVVQLAKDIRNADIDVLLDRWDSPPGSDLGRYIDRILNSDFVIVIGTPDLQRKYEADNIDPVVAAELELIALRLRQRRHYGHTVIPILLQGEANESFMPILQKLVNIDFRKNELYFSRLFMIIWQLWSLPLSHPMLEELQNSIET